MGYLTRNKVYEKVSAEKNAKKVYIICEGQNTEYNYFRYFQGFSSNIDILPIPSIDGKSDPQKLKEQAIQLFLGEEQHLTPKYLLSNEYKDEVWFVIDTDRWNEGGKIDQLKQFCNEQNKKSGKWSVVQSNPCFEIWQYYHFFNQNPETNEVSQCVSFKQFVNRSIPGGFNNSSMPIEIATAIKNSKMNFKIENDQPVLYATQVYQLAEVIVSFIRESLSKAKENSNLS